MVISWCLYKRIKCLSIYIIIILFETTVCMLTRQFWRPDKRSLRPTGWETVIYTPFSRLVLSHFEQKSYKIIIFTKPMTRSKSSTTRCWVATRRLRKTPHPRFLGASNSKIWWKRTFRSLLGVPKTKKLHYLCFLPKKSFNTQGNEVAIKKLK